MYGDFTERWVITENWTYTANLKPILPSLGTGSSKTLLVFYGIDTVANIVRSVDSCSFVSLIYFQTLLGKPVAWVNNQFQQYVFDGSDIVSKNVDAADTNLTVSFESAWLYGKNVSTLPEMEFFPAGLQIVRFFPPDFLPIDN